MRAKKIKYNDYPIEECAEAAEAIIAKGGTIHQKWSCRHCGARQTMEEPNSFSRAGRCGECGKITIIAKCNYLALYSVMI